MQFTRFTRACARCLGSPKALFIALIALVFWGMSGPLLGFSATWQLLINTSTTIFTFLCMFILQNSQEHGDKAIHVKLDELIFKMDAADNKFVRVEQKEETDIEHLDKLHDPL